MKAQVSMSFIKPYLAKLKLYLPILRRFSRLYKIVSFRNMRNGRD